MKQLMILLALSFAAITVSAQEVTEVKSDTSFLEGREFIKEMNAKLPQEPVKAPKQTKAEKNASKEFSEYTQRMAMIMRRLNSGQPLPSEEELEKAKAEKRARDWDSSYLQKARVEMRLMNEKTNPPRTAGKDKPFSGSGGSFSFGKN